MPPTSATPHSAHANVDQLRHAIDRGRTGSKVPHADPAAAPLGTDEEAAGTPPAPETVTRTYQRETGNPAAHSGSANASHSPTRSKSGHAVPSALIFAVLALMALTAVIFFLTRGA
jgi:cobalamin biosynthesis Mg chelatase CobN